MAKEFLLVLWLCVYFGISENKRQDSCGVRKDEYKRIVGGKPSSLWPWVGALLVQNGKEVKVFCGVSLISQKWAVTAAHCVHNLPLDLPLEKFNKMAEEGRIRVLFGDLKYEDALKTQNLWKIKNARMMKSFNDKYYDYDVALIELEENVKTKFYEPVCLDDGHFKVGENCVMVGWGSTDSTMGPFPDRLLEADCPILSDAKCLDLFTSEFFNERQLCFGFDDVRRGVCSADSGGPVVCKKDEVWYLTAVISAAYLKTDKEKPYLMDCAWPGYYQKHTKISHPEIRQWIKEHTGI